MVSIEKFLKDALVAAEKLCSLNSLVEVAKAMAEESGTTVSKAKAKSKLQEYQMEMEKIVSLMARLVDKAQIANRKINQILEEENDTN